MGEEVEENSNNDKEVETGKFIQVWGGGGGVIDVKTEIFI